MVDPGATSWQELQPETTPSAAPHGRRPPHACGQVNPGDPQATPAGAEHHASKVTLRPPPKGNPRATHGPRNRHPTTGQHHSHNNPAGTHARPSKRSAPTTHQIAQVTPEPSHSPSSNLTNTPQRRSPSTHHAPHGDAASRRNSSKDDRRSTPTQQRNARHSTQPGTDWRDVGEEGVWGRVRGGVARGVGGRVARAPAFRLLACPLFGPLGVRGPVSLLREGVGGCLAPLCDDDAVEVVHTAWAWPRAPVNMGRPVHALVGLRAASQQTEYQRRDCCRGGVHRFIGRPLEGLDPRSCAHCRVCQVLWTPGAGGLRCRRLPHT